MGQVSDLTGKRFNRLTAISLQYTKNSHAYWLFRCDCGTEKILRGNVVVYGTTISCGCFQKETKTKHALYYHPMYKIWNAMMQRCYNSKQAAYKEYGGRGIVVCDEWQEVSRFIEDMYPTYIEGLSIERIDVNGIYCYDNCTWADNSMQGFNKRKPSNNKSGKTGVAYLRGKWQAYIYKDGKKILLDSYEDKEDAIKARIKAEVEIYGFSKE